MLALAFVCFFFAVVVFAVDLLVQPDALAKQATPFFLFTQLFWLGFASLVVHFMLVKLDKLVTLLSTNREVVTKGEATLEKNSDGKAEKQK
jgi:hypothetical protein